MIDASLTFRDLTLGYNSHPCYRIISTAPSAGLADRCRRRQWLGKVDADEGNCRRVEADGRRGRPVLPACALPICRSNPNSTARFPARVVDLVSLGLWPKRGLLGRYASEDRDRCQRR